MRLRNIVLLSILCLILLLEGCARPKPDNVDNICHIFKQYPDWYHATDSVNKRWGVPIYTQMAIIHQESGFNGQAKPPRRKLLWIIPWTRPSSAYGYSQALKGTWEHYKRSAGRLWVSRDKFADATDFIGWYADQAKQKAGIKSYDAYSLYLAYHDGIGGFSRKTYLKKPWLMQVASKVKNRAWNYRQQLLKCENSLKRRSWFWFW